MQVLSYNPVDNAYFIGLSLKEFDQLSKKYSIEYGYNSNYESVKQNAIMLESRSDYKDMIKETYGIDEAPFVCVVVNENMSIQVVSSHYPFGPLWNGYSPWKCIRVYNIVEISMLYKDLLEASSTTDGTVQSKKEERSESAQNN